MAGGLSGLRVVELGGGVSAPIAGKVLADLGATVVKVEPPGGDPERGRGPFRGGRPDPEGGGNFIYLNANKRGVVLDLHAPADRERFDRLAARADLVLHNLPPREMEACGLDYARLSAANPRLVMLSITPFGLTGPYRDWAGSDLTLTHGGGWGWLCPGNGAPADRPPIKAFGRHTLAQAGLHGAVAAMGACLGAARSGQGEHIDLSVLEMVPLLLGQFFGKYTYTGEAPTRYARNHEPNSFYPCADGFCFMICPEQAQWERLVALMGHPAWAVSDKFSSREQRGRHGQELKAGLSAWTRQHTAEELFHLCQRERIAVAPMLRHDQLEAQPQLRAREFFVTATHPVAGELRLPGAPYLLRHRHWALRRPAPALGEADGELERLLPAGPTPAAPPSGAAAPPLAPGELPLAGVRVLDFTWVWAGPHTTLMLALLGAEVIKVESSLRPDITRRSAHVPPELGPGLNRSGYFNQLGQGKKSVGINLGHPEGAALVKRLAATCDVMVSNFGVGVLEKMGLGPEVMSAVNPRLIIAMISGFGQTGPLRGYAGYGPLVLPLAGVSTQTGYGDGLPQDVGMAYGDPNAAAYCAFAIIASLWARRHHGEEGQLIDLSLWETMCCTGFEGWMAHALGLPPGSAMGNRDPLAAPHNLYRCAGEDRWVAVSAEDEAQWRGLCAALGQPALAADPRFATPAARKANEDALDALIGGWCADRDRWAVTEALQAHGVAAFPCLDMADVVANAHLQARGAFTRWPHPEVGERVLSAPPWHLLRYGRTPGGRAPLLAEHTDAVLEAIGVDAAERRRLRAAGAIE